MKVLQGPVPNQPDKTRHQVETAIALQRYPDVSRRGRRERGVAARRHVGARARPFDPRGQRRSRCP
jgi:hypothetical protein